MTLGSKTRKTSPHENRKEIAMTERYNFADDLKDYALTNRR